MELIPWWTMLPRAVDPTTAQTNALRAQALRMQLAEQQRTDEARNALAAAAGGPGGLSSPEAISALMRVDPRAGIALAQQMQSRNALMGMFGAGGAPAAGSTGGTTAGAALPPGTGGSVGGFIEPPSPDQVRNALAAGADPKTVMGVMEFGTKMAHSQAQTQAEQEKIVRDEYKYATDQMWPAVSAWKDNVKKFGIDRANQLYYEQRKSINDQLRNSGAVSAIKDRLRDDVPPAEAERNILGFRGSMEQEKEARAARKEEATIFKPEFTGDVIGADGKIESGVPLAYGGPNGYIDTRTNTPAKLAAQPNIVKIGTQPQFGGGGVAAGQEGVHGADYLKTLQPGLSTQVKALAEGRMQFPSGFALRSPYWQQMLQAVAQYDPSFDAVNYNARYRTRVDFTSGPSARAMTSFNTAIGHLGTLLDAAEKLNNRDWPVYNTVANYLTTQRGDPRVVEFNTAKQAVSDELTRAFRMTGGNVSDIKGWEENLSSAGSPAQLRGAVRQAVTLLASRIDAIGQQYRRGMGTTSDVLDLLTPHAKATLKKLPGGSDLIEEESGVAAPGASGGAATPASIAPNQQGQTIEPSGGAPDIATSAPAQAMQPEQSAQVSNRSGGSGPIAIGDSIARGFQRFGGVSGTGKDLAPTDTTVDAAGGRSPSTILTYLKNLPDGALRGRHVIFSTGVSNAPNEIGLVPQQLAELKRLGAAGVRVVGVGTRAGEEGGQHFDLGPYNAQIQGFAKAAGDDFLGGLPAVVHPSRDYYRQAAGRNQRGEQPPPAAVAKLKEGIPTRFGNGQVWTLRNGQPERVQ